MLLSLFFSHSIIAAPNKTTPNILILGDSLSAGFMLEKGSEWPALLQKKLDNAQLNYQVINASISGETSLGGLSRLKKLLKKHQPQWLILELGANDGLQGLSITQFKKNMQTIIELTQQQQASVLLLGMHIPPNYGKRYSKSFHEVYLTLQADYNLPLVPFFLEGIAGVPSLNLTDGIHPTAQAQPLVLNNIWPQLNLQLSTKQ